MNDEVTVESTDEQIYTPTEAFASVVSQVEARTPGGADLATRAEIIASMMVTLGLLDGFPEPGIFDNYEMGTTSEGEYAGVITMFCRRCSTVLLIANDVEVDEDADGNVKSVPSQYRMTLADFGLHALEHEQERHPDDDD